MRGIHKALIIIALICWTVTCSLNKPRSIRVFKICSATIDTTLCNCEAWYFVSAKEKYKTKGITFFAEKTKNVQIFNDIRTGATFDTITIYLNEQ